MSLNKQLISFEGEFFDMLNERSNVLKRQGVSNCIGTALFLVGELPRDEFIYGREHEEILRKLSQTNFPGAGYLIGWRFFNRTYHLGVITSVNPLLITNRRGENGPLFKNEPFDHVDKIYRRQCRKIVYYVPRKFEDFLID